MNRDFSFSFLRVTESAAIAASRLIGRGDREAADQAAVDAMRKSFHQMPIAGRIVIGEGERDEAPMLYIGEKVGSGWNSVDLEQGYDIAVDPLEGTNLCAFSLPGAISVMAISGRDQLLKAPDTYMNKLVVGPMAQGAIDLCKSPGWNLASIAEAKKCKIEELVVAILDRPRHEVLISEVRASGARIRLVSDGDVAAAILTCLPGGNVDVLMGIGGAPEGVIAAAAVRCLGGDFQGKLEYRNESERRRAEEMGILDHERVYKAIELASGNIIFVATGITTGDLLDGVRFDGRMETHSLLMDSQFGRIQWIRTLEG